MGSNASERASVRTKRYEQNTCVILIMIHYSKMHLQLLDLCVIISYSKLLFWGQTQL